MTVDYPRAWQIAEASPMRHHSKQCSYRQFDGGLLCHSEALDKELHGAGGKVLVVRGQPDGGND